MIGSIFQQYQNLLNNASGNVLHFKEQISGTLWFEGNITSLSGSQINPFASVEQTKFSMTCFDISGGRLSGIDNHEHKPLHQHISGSEINISGTYNLATIGSYAFLNFFK